ncbi:MAG TPA: pyridoxal-dependent decarboxylase [Acidimicrobiales bacterium]|nr:pyridoxal-dependent decarboxylase [Acidimicrobiales bacterium]
MHTYTPATDALAQQVIAYALERMRMDPPPLDAPRTPADLAASIGPTITPDGIGGAEALRLWIEELAPACISEDHPRALSFVPTAPTEAATIFDLVVGASSIYAGSWLEGSGAVYAENQALRWIADLAGLPDGAGGCFVSGGSAGNLSALVAARHAAATARAEAGRDRPIRWRIVASAEAHSSIASTAKVMDVEVIDVPVDERGRLTAEATAAVLDGLGPDELESLFAIVATAGTTNAGQIDDLAGVAEVATRHDLWFHVDGAYGGAALVAPSVRDRFAGIERADSLVVDPHKWLYTPFDCAALLYRRPELARRAHTQHAAYLEIMQERKTADAQEWDPSDYAYHLTRRARGLPLWFSLATHGTDAYRDAIESTLATTRAGAALIAERDHVELVMAPTLSVLMFRRLGWSPADYRSWSDRQLADGLTLTVPTTWRGESVLRFCVVNPRTTPEDLATILDTMT